MKFTFSFFLGELVFLNLLIAIPVYTFTHKKEMKFIDQRIPWQFYFPFDFQYRIFKEGNDWNFEGINIGLPKIFIRTSTIQNKKQLSPVEFQKEYLKCKEKNDSFTLKNHKYFSTYLFCRKGDFLEFKSYIYLNQIYDIIYITFYEKTINENFIHEFLNSIEYKRLP